MGFYSFEDLREKVDGSFDDLREKVDGSFDDLRRGFSNTEVISGEMEAEYAKKRADFYEKAGGKEVKIDLNSYIFDPKNRSKVDDLVVEARKLKHNICDWDYDFLGKYRVESVEAERLKAVLDDYILLVGLLEKGGK